jgi:predicted phage tail protein
MKLLVMKSLENIECFDCPYNEYKSIFNWLVMTKGRAWVNEIYSESMLYALCNIETEATLVLEEKAHYFDNPPFDLFMIAKPIDGEGNTGQILIVVAQVLVMAVAAYFTFGASLAIQAAIMTASIVVNVGLSYLSYRLAPHTAIGGTEAGSITTSNLFGRGEFTLEQGGVVPLLYGHAYAKGTLICSSVTTMQG